MQITATMDLVQLSELMGDEATLIDATNLRDVLVQAHNGRNTDELSEREWLALIDQACS